jgi:quercetin dioxygenase-like cupin family protein
LREDRLKITTRSQALTELKPMDAAHFTGKAASRSLVLATPALPAFAAVVRFGTRVRNHWHSHAGGQLLHVIDGEGWVQARRAGAQRVGAGDTVWTEPAEEHWHGAGGSGPMAHIAVTIGETSWLEESPAPPD